MMTSFSGKTLSRFYVGFRADVGRTSPASFLCSLNGRTPNLSGNDVGYNNLTNSERQNGDSILRPVGHYETIVELNQASGLSHTFNDLVILANAFNNIDFNSLLNLTKSFESICKLAQAVNSNNNKLLSSHSSSLDINTS